MAFDRSRSIPEPVNESDDEPDGISLWDVDWEDPVQVRALMAEIDAKVEAEEDPEPSVYAVASGGSPAQD